MAENYTLKDLIGDSIRVYKGMMAVWPQYNKEEAVNFDVATFNGTYCSNNGTLAFVIDNTLYVTPATRRAYGALQDFPRKEFYVPFSNWDYPKEEYERWKLLCKMKDRLSREEFVSDCKSYSDKHGIQALPSEVIERCFVMPENGVEVIYLQGYKETYYPKLNSIFLDSGSQQYIGKYCTNNGRVVFVYRDGRTMVTKGYWILDELRSAGYKEDSLFVPFSNSETITDAYLKNKWDNIKKC